MLDLKGNEVPEYVYIETPEKETFNKKNANYTRLANDLHRKADASLEVFPLPVAVQS